MTEQDLMNVGIEILRERADKADLYEEALKIVLDKLQEVDKDQASRGSFASGIVYCQFHGLDKPIFEEETKALRNVLGIKDPEPTVPVQEPNMPIEKKEEFTLGDL